jgi:Ethylbenzene dehydrogenase/Prokaryotic cytochrome b561
MPDDTAARAARTAPTSAKRMRPRTDFGTVIAHWAIAALFIVNVLTGFRIAADAPDATWSRVLAAIALQGEVVAWHALSAWILVAATAGYIVLLLFARLIPRVSLDAGRIRALSSHDRSTRWQSINVIIYWFAFAALVGAIGSGTVLYFAPAWVPHQYVAAAHRAAAWTLVVYVAVHAGAQWWSGGVQGLLKIVRPRFVYVVPACIALVGGAAIGIGAYVADGMAIQPLVIARVSAPPRLDGEPNDAAWRNVRPASVVTRYGANLPGGEVTVTVRAVRDATMAYFLFEWPDSTRSQKHLPLRKTASGWEVIQLDYARQDEDDFYEDKFGVMLARDSRAAVSTSHLGSRPIDDRPGPAGGRGLHYTADGSIVDVWHWKSVRTGPMGQIDDNYFGPPLEPPRDPKARYTGGYTQDPKTGGNFIQNWKTLGDGRIVPLWLPRRPEVLTRLGEVNLDPNIGDAGEWWLPKELVLPYSPELDATLPVGTILPSVVIEGPFEGDRGDVRAVAKWSRGWWRLETSRMLDTGSKYDVPIADGTYFWVAVFDHTQTRHSYHLHPLRFELR